MRYLNIAAYHFTHLDELEQRKEKLHTHCKAEGIRGTILLAKEGINCFLAGEESPLRQLLIELKNDPQLQGLEAKESWSSSIPYRRLLVKIKKEIITLRQPGIRPQENRAPRVSPSKLKTWLDQGHDDEGYPIVLLDTRNDFEIALGTFSQAQNPGLKSFGELPEKMASITQNHQDWQDKTIVSFCTGGIRCEKAAPYLITQGYRRVWQLDGGILGYFAKVGNAHYTGDCFVFDRRVALTPKLEASGHVECHACRAVVSIDQQNSPQYKLGVSCPACAGMLIPLYGGVAV